MGDRKLLMVSKGSDMTAAEGYKRHIHRSWICYLLKWNKTVKMQQLKKQTSQNQMGENVQPVPDDCWVQTQCRLLFVMIFRMWKLVTMNNSEHVRCHQKADNALSTSTHDQSNNNKKDITKVSHSFCQNLIKMRIQNIFCLMCLRQKI